MIETYEKYLSAIDKIKKEVLEDENIDSLVENPFVNIKTNTDKFLTNLNYFHLLTSNDDFDRKSLFYKEVLFYQLINQLDTICDYKLFIDELISIENQELISVGSLYCSFHYGAYIQVPTVLKMLNVDFVIVSMGIDGNDVISWEINCDNIDAKLNQPHSINPMDKESIFQIFKYLRKGISVLIYIDGVQASMDQQNKRNQKILFLEQQILLSTGIMEVARKLKVPVISIVAERLENFKILVSLYSIKTVDDYSEKVDVQNSIQKMMNILATYVTKKPGQWQEWSNIHQKMIFSPRKNRKKFSEYVVFRDLFKFLSYKSISGSWKPSFNCEKYEILEVNSESYVLCIDNYLSFKITFNLAQILLSLNKMDITQNQLKQILPYGLLQDLLSHNIIYKRS
ncbi:hypothetical protein [Myroides odoratus]|uniref:hypothetical protein n=1 Tax=Myroides odoratus TaxID=256 RepID=UPI0039B0E092